MGLHRIGDVGAVFQARLWYRDDTGKPKALDLRGATVVFVFKRPAADPIEVDGAVADAGRGIARYRVADDTFLSVTGTWTWAVRVSTASYIYTTGTREFQVEAALAAP